MSNIKTIVRGVYDIQKLRIQMGNRIVGNFKAKLGQKPGESEDTLDQESKDLLAKIRKDFDLVADGVVDHDEDDKRKKKAAAVASHMHALLDKHFATITQDGVPSKKKFVGDPVISDYTELVLLQQYKELVAQENRQFSTLESVLRDYPIWTEFMEHVTGCGPAMAGVIISEIDIHKAKYPSSLWMYAGLDVAPNGEGRSRKADHLIDREYLSREGKVETKKSITFNPFLKTKLTGVLAGSFIKTGRKYSATQMAEMAGVPDGEVKVWKKANKPLGEFNSKYAKAYYDYKNRLENHPVHKEKTKGHRHSMALRYIVKLFLIDLHTEWRTLEGLPTSVPYHEAKLGLKHGVD